MIEKSLSMNRLTLACLCLLLGCRETPETKNAFVQGSISIIPPVEVTGEYAPTEDGGTQQIEFQDAKGKSFDVFVDRRIGTTTYEGLYLNGYPGTSNSVFIVDRDRFTEMLGIPKAD